VSPQRREIRSAYIEWAKLRAGARFNLAASAVAPLPFEELHARIEDIHLNGPAGYGYEPLIEGLATPTRVTDRSGMELFDIEPIGFDEALRCAVAEDPELQPSTIRRSEAIA